MWMLSRMCVFWVVALAKAASEERLCLCTHTSLQAPNKSAPLMSAESAQQSCFMQCGGGRAETTVHRQSLKVRHKRDAAEQA